MNENVILILIIIFIIYLFKNNILKNFLSTDNTDTSTDTTTTDTPIDTPIDTPTDTPIDTPTDTITTETTTSSSNVTTTTLPSSSNITSTSSSNITTTAKQISYKNYETFTASHNSVIYTFILADDGILYKKIIDENKKISDGIFERVNVNDETNSKWLKIYNKFDYNSNYYGDNIGLIFGIKDDNTLWNLYNNTSLFNGFQFKSIFIQESYNDTNFITPYISNGKSYIVNNNFNYAKNYISFNYNFNCDSDENKGTNVIFVYCISTDDKLYQLLLNLKTLNFIGQPLKMSDDTDWISIDYDSAYFFGIKTDGSLFYWSIIENNFVFNPIKISIGPWKTIKTDNNTTYGLKTDGTLWKLDAFNVFINSIKLGTNFRELYQYNNNNNNYFDDNLLHYYAINEQNELYTWGVNRGGMLGIEDDYTSNIIQPTKISDITCKLFATSINFQLCVTNDNKIYNWGYVFSKDNNHAINKPIQIEINIPNIKNIYPFIASTWNPTKGPVGLYPFKFECFYLKDINNKLYFYSRVNSPLLIDGMLEIKLPDELLL